MKTVTNNKAENFQSVSKYNHEVLNMSMAVINKCHFKSNVYKFACEKAIATTMYSVK